ncbi:MAG: competence/damage-inducible protein A [Armatimonadetes bacterium]|nr:competence/damage-inducible protein A [Candidatus Hippobium faecium]
MTAEIISVGTELLMGQIVDTDAAALSRELPSLGINLFYRETVGDNRERLSELLRHALDRSDIVFAIGGLGPTDDDITKETVAEVTGHKLVLNETEAEKLKNYFISKGRPFPESNLKQACFPENARILKNPVGTAPGCVFEKNGKYVIIMPGPPKEFNLMLKEEVLPFLKEICPGDVIFSEQLKTFGISESLLGEKLRPFSDRDNPTVADYLGDGDIEIRITAKGKSEEECRKLTGDTKKQIEEMLGDFVYGYNEDTIPSIAKNLLIEKGLTISLAESCTGGLIGKILTDFSGISSSLLFDAVTYSNSAKMKVLGVKPETLDKHGAVSQETAFEMCSGVRHITDSDIAISVTGIAGPNSDDTEKPVGLVYLCIYYKEKYYPFKLNLLGSRDNIRKRTALTALNEMRKIISEN